MGGIAGFLVQNSNAKAVNASSDIKEKVKMGVFVSAPIERKFNEKITVQAEPGFALLGAKYEFTDSETRYLRRLEFESANLPVLFKYYVHKNININAGASFVYIVSANSKLVDGVDGRTPFGEAAYTFLANETDYNDYVKRFSINPFVGLEIVSDRGFYFSLRYSLGLSNIAETHPDNELSSLKNSYLNLGFGYKFKLK
nr:outer membrane beta-barrel protein [Chryseobacterium sp.]